MILFFHFLMEFHYKEKKQQYYSCNLINESPHFGGVFFSDLYIHNYLRYKDNFRLIKATGIGLNR